MKQLIINITESYYQKAIEYKLDAPTLIVEAIRHGIPLPKGHGRIADMDEAIKCIKDVEGEDAIWATSLIEWACSKRTIIEADKETDDYYRGAQEEY